MPAYDNLNLFHDGTTIAQGTTLEKTSTTRADGSAVLDLKQTGSKGLGVMMILPAAVSGDQVTVTIQGCATVDGTYVALSSMVGAAIGAYTTRFQTTYRYVRASITTGAGTGDVNPVIFVLPWAFPENY